MGAIRAWLGALVFAVLLAGCATDGQQIPTETDNDFQLGDVAKTDVNLIVETQQREAMSYLRLLMLRLYSLNPGEWRKGGFGSRQAAVKKIFGDRHRWSFKKVSQKQGYKAVHLALDPDYDGDRVLAFIIGLGSMIHSSYNGRYDFFILDNLQPWKLHNSARNVELAAWKLGRARDRDGAPLLRVKNDGAPDRSPSSELLFGKIIALQDTISKIAAQRTKRGVKQAIQFLMFLPL